MEKEDLKWKQRAKENLIKYQDNNTKYFHVCASQRREVNPISKFQNECGRLCNKNEEIANAFVQYYKQLFTTYQLVNIGDCIYAIEKKKKCYS